MKKLISLLAILLAATPAFASSKQTVNIGTQVTGTLAVGNGGTACTGVRVISSGSSDTNSSTACTIAWNSSTASAKTESIAACSSTNSGLELTIKDEYGTAGTYNINITPVSGTIDGISNYSIQTNKSAVSLQCDGSSNWMVI